MDGALGWISAVAEWFGQFVPRWVVVPTTHGAVKFVRGSRVVLLGPGLHFYWPLVTIFVLHPVAEQTTDLAAQTITTGDGRPALVRAVIAYEIEKVNDNPGAPWEEPAERYLRVMTFLKEKINESVSDPA